MANRLRHIYQFGPYCVDATERILHKNGQEIVLTAKSFDVLLVLVQNSGHIVEKETFMREVWEGSFVEDSNITQNVSVLKKIFREDGDNHRYIETISKRGYRFIAPVKERWESAAFSTTLEGAGPFISEDSIPTYSDSGHPPNRGRWVLVLSATITDIDKPIAEALEAHLRKLTNDVNLTLLRIEDGSIILTLEGTQVGFEQFYELVESGRLSDVLGFPIKHLLWLGEEGGTAVGRGYTLKHLDDDSLSGYLTEYPKLSSPARVVTAEPAFNKLLALLDSNRDRAGELYVSIRAKLVKMFERRAVGDPESLADETINRVAEKAKELGNFSGQLDLYFYGVARNVYREFLKSAPLAKSSLSASESPVEMVNEQQLSCLERCLQTLRVDDRKLILAYYAKPQRKSDDRKRLAAELGVTAPALRARIHRVRRHLEQCVADCMERSSFDSKKT